MVSVNIYIHVCDVCESAFAAVLLCCCVVCQTFAVVMSKQYNFALL